MARAQVVSNDVVIELTLSLDEALYVYGALNRTSPRDNMFGEGSEDPVYDALGEAIRETGRPPIDGLDFVE